MTPLLLVLGGYLVGAIPVGLLVARTAGVDIRAKGSGNIGTMNVLRNVGRGAAVATLLGDLLKGFLPVFAARLALVDERWVIAVGVATLFGAAYSVFLRFAGGKAVAASLGVLVGLAAELAVVGLLVYLPLLAVFRYSSVASLAAAAAVPIAAVFAGYAADPTPNRFQFVLAMSALVFWRHRDNIRRLAAGTEPKIGRRA
jgi:glycerol-3-phosphate acyltransferase PlsY